MKVYYPPNPFISRAMWRIREALIEYAPPWVRFVLFPQEADIHILDYIGQHPTIEDWQISGDRSLFKAIPSTPKCKEYVIIFHCEPTPGKWDAETIGKIEHLFHSARLVFGFLSPEWLEVFKHFDFSKINYFQTPWGFNPRVFHPSKAKKKDILVLMTGYVAEPEGLDSVYQAAVSSGGEVVHVGGNIGFDGRPGYKRYEGIPDTMMQELYSRSEYVNAIRSPYGFELPGIEGAACGAQPIYLDLPCYRYWFGDIGLFVPPDEIWDGLRRIFELRVKREDLCKKVRRFAWGNIAPKIWQKIL